MDDQTTRSGVIAPYAMILDQSAHLDWDWIRNFAQNFWYGGDGNGVQAILEQAIADRGNLNNCFRLSIKFYRVE